MSERGLRTPLVLCLLTVSAGAPFAAFSEEKGLSPGLENLILDPAKPLERELTGGQTHTYQFQLKAGQYLYAAVEQRGIDLIVRVQPPNGEQAFEVDNPSGTRGQEVIRLLSNRHGTYQLEVRAFRQEAPKGKYRFKVVELREANPEDQERVIASRRFEDGEKLRKKAKDEFVRKSLDAYAESLPHWRAAKDKIGEGTSLTAIGAAHYALGENEEAIRMYNQAVDLFKQVGSKLDLSRALGALGYVLAGAGQNQKAIEVLTECARLAGETKDAAAQSQALNDIGMVYRKIGENKKAIESYENSLVIRNASGDIAGQSQTLSNLAVAYDVLGEHQKALNYFNRALPLARSAGDVRGQGYVLSGMGLVYSALGDREKAIETYQQALEMMRAGGDKRGEMRTLGVIATAFINLQQEAKALEYLEPAVSLARSMHDPQALSRLLYGVGTVHSHRQDYTKALNYFSESADLARSSGDRNDEATALLNTAQVLEELEQHEKALDAYGQALAISEVLGLRPQQIGALSGIAEVQTSLDNLTEARGRIDAAIKIIESVRGQVASSEFRASYLASVEKHYARYINILMQMHRKNPGQGHDGEALEISERARARMLLETLSEAHADIRQGVDPALLQSERELQRKLEEKEIKQIALRIKKGMEKQAADLAKEIDALSNQYQDIEAQIRLRSPHYAALTQPVPLKVSDIQAGLDSDTLLLEYALGEKRSYLWVVSTTSVRSFELPPRRRVNELARKTHDQLIARQLSAPGKSFNARSSDAKYWKEATVLSDVVLGPAADLLQSKRLVLATDGALEYIPFAALPIPPSRNAARAGKVTPLTVEHEIVSLPSFSALAMLRRETEGRGGSGLAILADPVFELEDPRVAQRLDKPAETKIELASREVQRAVSEFRAAGVGIGRLAFTRREAERIADLTDQPLVALDFAASRKLAMSEDVARRRIIHIASHGLLDSQHPELSGILLSTVDEQGAPQNGFLGLRDLYNLKLSADLVVLSACQTGLGRQIRGEGLVGLTRGFMYAGSPRVVASLWKVNDLATSELMARFYEKMLRSGLTPSKALREAQIQMWKQKRWSAPYYWAGFVMHGEWRS